MSTARSWRIPFGIAAVGQGWIWLSGATYIGEWFEYTAGSLVSGIISETVFVLVPLYAGAVALGHHRAMQQLPPPPPPD